VAEAGEFDEYTDVVVVGSGGGITGAYTAAREGLSVALVEATDKFGGTTAFSGGGGMWFPCNPVLRRKGSDDTIEEALTYFHAVVGDRTPVELQDAYVLGGARLIEYLEEDDGFAFSVLPWPDYFGNAPGARRDGLRHIVSKPLPGEALGPYADKVRGPLDNERLGAAAPDLLTGGRALIGRFLAALRRFPNATVHLDSPMTDLITEDGAVVGVEVERDGKAVRIGARRGVLLAAGGFEQNAAMRRAFGVPGRVEDTMGAPGNTGAAHQAAIRAGADTDLMDQAWWSPGFTHPDGRSTFSLWFTGGIFVNSDGRRFVNESAPYDRIGRVIIDQMRTGAMELPFWMVYDDREGEIPPVKSASVSLVDSQLFRDAGLWHTADTVEDLARVIGVPPPNLVATVTRFNELVAGGADSDFGRGDEAYDRAFSGGKLPLVPIDRPPFHAAAFGLSDLGTKGGLRTDSHARVLDAAGHPIPGLYAAGNTMAAVSGTTYPGGGNPIGASMLFSHLAARDMARRAADADPETG
jgi:3-oxosteroid 1-dehydrogenase